MVWPNPLVLYHGCDLVAAGSISATGIDPTRGRPRTDFGQGFYVTTYLHQAKNWANARYLRRRSARNNGPAVLEIHVDRQRLARLRDVVFVIDASDYWSMVTRCRNWSPGTPSPHAFQIAWGPVSLWPQQLVVKDCDQMSVHDPAIVPLLNLQPNPIVPPPGQATF